MRSRPASEPRRRRSDNVCDHLDGGDHAERPAISCTGGANTHSAWQLLGRGTIRPDGEGVCAAARQHGTSTTITAALAASPAMAGMAGMVIGGEVARPDICSKCTYATNSPTTTTSTASGDWASRRPSNVARTHLQWHADEPFSGQLTPAVRSPAMTGAATTTASRRPSDVAPSQQLRDRPALQPRQFGDGRA